MMKNRIKNITGIGILEVLIVVLVIGVAFFGLVRLTGSSIKSANYSNMQKQVNLAGQFILDRIQANLITTGNSSSASHYNEGTNWVSSNTQPATMCDTGSNCTQLQIKSYDLYKWHQYLDSLKINSLKCIVCLDGNTPGVPTQSSPNCNSSGSSIYIKLVWANNLVAAESAGVKNYLIIPIKTTTNLALVESWINDASGGVSNVGQAAVNVLQFTPSFTQCYGSNCTGRIVVGACNGSDCSGSTLLGNCNGSTSCSNAVIVGACNSSITCSNSLIMGDCNSNNCSNSYIAGSCNQGNCSRSVITGNCWGSNCTNSLIYGNCNGDCTGSVVFGGDNTINALQSGGGSGCWGTGCPGVASNALYPSITYNSSTGTISGISQNMMGILTFTSMNTTNCQNGGSCNNSVIDGNCGNNGSCSSSLIDGNCGNGSTCNSAIINGSCGNNANCSNAIILNGSCGNNSNCNGATVVGNCANNGSCCGNNANCTGMKCYKTDGSVGTC